MSTAEPVLEEDAFEARPRLVSLEIGGWPGLAEDVRVPLDERCTLLVGKNGAGKSLLMEGMFWAARRALRAYDQELSSPLCFRCEIERPGDSALTYEYRLEPGEPGADLDALEAEGAPRPRKRFWYERCWTNDGEELWKVEEGTLTRRGARPMLMPPGLGFFGIDRDSGEAGDERALVERVLRGLMVVLARMPRIGITPRREVVSTGAPGPGNVRIRSVRHVRLRGPR